MKWTVKDREFTLRPITMRVRAEVNKLAAKGDEIDYAKLENDEDTLNNFMSVVLDGDHNGLNWFDLDMEEVQPIVAAFFIESQKKTLKWKECLLSSLEVPENTTKENESKDETPSSEA